MRATRVKQGSDSFSLAIVPGHVSAYILEEQWPEKKFRIIARVASWRPIDKKFLLLFAVT
jgi:hypothetical protein